jgi:hypothetical protein
LWEGSFQPASHNPRGKGQRHKGTKAQSLKSKGKMAKFFCFSLCAFGAPG